MTAPTHGPASFAPRALPMYNEGRNETASSTRGDEQEWRKDCLAKWREPR